MSINDNGLELQESNTHPVPPRVLRLHRRDLEGEVCGDGLYACSSVPLPFPPLLIYRLFIHCITSIPSYSRLFLISLRPSPARPSLAWDGTVREWVKGWELVWDEDWDEKC